jgi:Uma2 family endonuclease
MDIALAIEVSGASLGYDRGLKAKLYARYGVREFWVVNAESRASGCTRSQGSMALGGSIEETPADATLITDAVPGLAIKIGELN